MPLAIPRSPLEGEMQAAAAAAMASEEAEMVVVGEATGGSGGSGEGKRKKTLGRRKIEIKPIKSKDAKHVCFSKRRDGVLKKATELCALTGAKVAVLVNSPAGKPYSYGHPSVSAVVDRYLDDRDDPARSAALALACEAPPPPQIQHEFDGERGRLDEAIAAEARRKKALDAAARAAGLWSDDDVKEAKEVAELPHLVAMLAALERARDEVIPAAAAAAAAAAAEHEMRMQYAAAAVAGGGCDACYYGFDDLVGDGGAFMVDYAGGACSKSGGGHRQQAAAAMDAQHQMALLMAGNAAAHAPQGFAAQMLMPPHDLPQAPLALSYGADDHSNFIAGYEGFAYDDLRDGGCHGAAFETEGSYFGTTTATTCNFFIG